MNRITSLSSIAPAVAAGAVAALISRRASPFGAGGRLSRGRLIALGGIGLTALATAGWRSRAEAVRLQQGSPARGDRQAGVSGAAVCVLTPEQTEGPYYIAGEKVRSDITERRPGTPLTLLLSVVDAATCAPIKGATVDVWHCDASGIYSGFEAASTGGAPGGPGPTDHDTFLRGIQPTDSHGVCRFQTIYPGWYRGRTVHIHVKVHVGGTVVHTGQLYFPDSLTTRVYQSGIYRARAADRDTWNGTDGIYRNGGAQSMLTLRRRAGGYTGAITLGVRRT
jgi:protocatechuate 3,4-dioxygenase beta subunit